MAGVFVVRGPCLSAHPRATEMALRAVGCLGRVCLRGRREAGGGGDFRYRFPAGFLVSCNLATPGSARLGFALISVGVGWPHCSSLPLRSSWREVLGDGGKGRDLRRRFLLKGGWPIQRLVPPISAELVSVGNSCDVLCHDGVGIEGRGMRISGECAPRGLLPQQELGNPRRMVLVRRGVASQLLSCSDRALLSSSPEAFVCSSRRSDRIPSLCFSFSLLFPLLFLSLSCLSFLLSFFSLSPPLFYYFVFFARFLFCSRLAPEMRGKTEAIDSHPDGGLSGTESFLVMLVGRLCSRILVPWFFLPSTVIPPRPL